MVNLNFSKKPKCFSILDSILKNTIYTSKFCHDDVHVNIYFYFDHTMTEYNNDLDNYFYSYGYGYHDYYYDMDH